MEWKNIYRGLLMGTSDLIPGVSGGTVAVILGIYDRMLKAISGLLSSSWKRHISFLAPLGIGVVISVFLLSRLIHYLLNEFYQPTQYFFLGLIIGVFPILVKKAEAKKHFQAPHFLIVLACAVGTVTLTIFKGGGSSVQIEPLTFLSGAGLFFSGWLASMATLLPGISGSFILLVIGVYHAAINALSTFNVPVITAIGSGFLIGFIVSSKGIRYLLRHFPHVMYAVTIGLIIGAVMVVYPGFPDGVSMLALSGASLLAGLGLSLFIGWRNTN